MVSTKSDINMYYHNLNDKLTQSHYPHLAKKLFNNLALPPGLILKNKLATQNICIYHPIDATITCLDNKEWDELFQLAKVSSATKMTRRKKPTSKKKTRRRKS
jgi:hypothetical protein